MLTLVLAATVLVADLADTKCRKGFDSAVWAVYDKVLQRLGRKANAMARVGSQAPLGG